MHHTVDSCPVRHGSVCFFPLFISFLFAAFYASFSEVTCNGVGIVSPKRQVHPFETVGVQLALFKFRWCEPFSTKPAFEFLAALVLGEFERQDVVGLPKAAFFCVLCNQRCAAESALCRRLIGWQCGESATLLALHLHRTYGLFFQIFV